MGRNKLFRSIAWSIIHLMAIIFLTVITQIGGVIYFFLVLFQRNLSILKRTVTGVILYFISVLLIIPFLAELGGRKALPFSGSIAPYNIVTCLLNRHYVNIETSNTLEKVSSKLNKQYKGNSILYLNANFPFFDGFPLLPHLSHSDGKKLDLAFYYQKDNLSTDRSPSFIGYGFHESAVNNEINYTNICTKKGYWQYNLLEKTIPLSSSKGYSVDIQRTKSLIRLLNEDQNTHKIFLEPHLQLRWNLKAMQKIRFHGCHAVRHDDHIHWQTK